MPDRTCVRLDDSGHKRKRKSLKLPSHTNSGERSRTTTQLVEVIPGPSRRGQTSPDPRPSLVPPHGPASENQPYTSFGLRKQNPLGRGVVIGSLIGRSLVVEGLRLGVGMSIVMGLLWLTMCDVDWYLGGLGTSGCGFIFVCCERGHVQMYVGVEGTLKKELRI